MKLKKHLIGGCSVSIPVNLIRSYKNDKCLYNSVHGAFDIEVTNYLKDNTRVGVPYLWMLTFDGDVIYYGRYLSDFVDFANEYLVNNDYRQVVYVHNLAYEWQFIRKYWEWDEVFLIGERRPVYARVGSLEFRCSYLLSNMSLDRFLNTYGVSIHKLSYDYSIIRFPWSRLTTEELHYCVNDTAGVWQAVNVLLEKEESDVTRIPYTSTGFVRKDIKRATCKSMDKNLIRRLSALDEGLYTALKSAFVGGNTHANRFYVGKILEDVYCYDIASSYPFAQVSGHYPVTPFTHVSPACLRSVKPDGVHAYLLKIRAKDIYLTNYFDPMPQISVSKCLVLNGAITDNGRILSADYLELWCTDIEYTLIERHYSADIDVIDAYTSYYGDIPTSIKSVISDYFFNKSTLKGRDNYLYQKSKEKLNSIYGMAAFDVGKRRYEYREGEYIEDDCSLMGILEKTTIQSTQAEPYAWGVWTTAIARWNLNILIEQAGSSFVYCDTDSIYSLDKIDLTAINEKNSRLSSAYGVYTSEYLYMGQWRIDKYCNRFRTWGAKKYCYEDKNGVHTVTAGVNKEAGVTSIEDYERGHVFKNATHTAWYVDTEISIKIGVHRVDVPSSVFIEDNDYTLGITDDYDALLYYIHGEDSEVRYVE